MDCFVARQPIFTKAMKVFGYELLYRDSHTDVVSGVDKEIIDGDLATSETIINSFQNIGIHKLTSGKRAFVNFTQTLIVSEVAMILPRDTLVIEVLEGIVPDAHVVRALENLKKAGYMIALDDFILDRNSIPYLPHSDIVKIDFLNTPIETIRVLASNLLKMNKILLAEKIESHAMFQLALEMGFTLFQGYYFSKPLTLRQKKIDPLRANCLRLMRLAGMRDISFSRYAEIIKEDVALAYSLLRLVNSAYFGLPQRVKGISHALSILGENEITKWIMLVSLSRMKEEKPEELMVMSLVRGRILEKLAEDLTDKTIKDDLFLLGMLSLMPLVLDMSMEDVLEELRLNEFLTENLLNQGEYAGLVSMLECYEAGDWDSALALAQKYGIPEDHLRKQYIEALSWSQKLAF